MIKTIFIYFALNVSMKIDEQNSSVDNVKTGHSLNCTRCKADKYIYDFCQERCKKRNREDTNKLLFEISSFFPLFNGRQPGERGSTFVPTFFNAHF